MEKMKSFVLLLRPQQWLKNLFIFLPLFFGQQLTDFAAFKSCLIAFVSYSLMASSIYCFNDIFDREADRLHPKKRLRPIASGAVSVVEGYGLMALMVLLSIAVAHLLPEDSRWGMLAVLAFYFLMNIAYCVRLKQIALVDVFLIATGFVLRILVGGIVSGVVLSHWIVLMTFLLALFLAFAKRRDDVVLYEDTGRKVRRNVNRYNLQFMNQAISLVASVTLVCYIMYTVSDEVVRRMGSPLLYVTSIFVLAGIIRYLQLTIVDVKSGSPTRVLMKDRFVQCCIVGWILVFILILYF